MANGPFEIPPHEVDLPALCGLAERTSWSALADPAVALTATVRFCPLFIVLSKTCAVGRSVNVDVAPIITARSLRGQKGHPTQPGSAVTPRVDGAGEAPMN
jgi:hypothetical protein